MSIYFLNTINEKIGIKPYELSANTDILEIIESKLKKKLEGKCIKQGYVKKNSLKIINRSIGTISEGHFTGDIIYKVKVCVEVCNPPEGELINCVIKNINKMGILAELDTVKESPLIILLPRHQHQENKLFKELLVGDSITVEILGKKFELNDTKIHLVALLVKKVTDNNIIKIKSKKKKRGGNNMDIYEKQNISEKLSLIDNNMRGGDNYEGELLELINIMKKNIKLEDWLVMEIDEKQKQIQRFSKYFTTENKLKKLYNEKWTHLTEIDKKNLILSKIDEDNLSNYSYEEEDILEV